MTRRRIGARNLFSGGGILHSCTLKNRQNRKHQMHKNENNINSNRKQLAELAKRLMLRSKVKQNVIVASITQNSISTAEPSSGRKCTCVCIHAYIHTYIHTCIHTYIHFSASAHPLPHTCVHRTVANYQLYYQCHHDYLERDRDLLLLPQQLIPM